MQTKNTAITAWIGSILLLIIAMILVGGLTRLTDSGLSITTWDIFKGVLPPWTRDAWEQAFDAYKKTTEFKKVNFEMTLDAFKTIFWWEWAHRFLGRFLGLVVLLPGLYFWIKGNLHSGMKHAFLIIFLGILFQGILGWWMVKSGLAHRVDVAPYRLMLHLGTAFLLLGYVKWVLLNLSKQSCPTPKYHRATFVLLCLIFIQICAGALVAGTDGGKVFTDFPLMNGDLIVDPYFHPNFGLFSLFEWQGAVQFNHRILAFIIIAYTAYLFVRKWRGPEAELHRPLCLVTTTILTFQFLLGVITLLHAAPFWFSFLHQLVAIFLFLVVLTWWHRESTGSVSK